MKLRVSKPNGKKLKLHYVPEWEYDKSCPRLELLESQDETNVFTVSKHKFEIELVKTLDKSIEMDVKLFHPSKRCIFSLTVVSLDKERSAVAKSVEFSTQSSGGHVKSESVSPDSAVIQVPAPDKKRKVGEEEMFLAESATVVPGPLHVNGVVRAKAFMQFSDIRLKTDIRDVVDALQIVTQLQGKTYQWRTDGGEEGTGGKRVVGLIAQEVQRVLPEVVKEDPETGLLSVSYAEILPVLIEAFKEFLRDYHDDQRDIKKELLQLQDQLDHFSNQLAETRSSDKEREVFVDNLTRASRQLFRVPIDPNLFSRPIDNYSVVVEVPKEAEPPVQKVPQAGVSSTPPPKKPSRIRLFPILQFLLFLVFLASLACLIVGVIDLIKDGALMEATPTVGSSGNDGDDDDDKGKKTTQAQAQTVTTVNSRGFALTGIGIAGIIASFVGCCCLLIHRRRGR